MHSMRNDGFLREGCVGLMKYILKFSKKGQIKYVSHLDMMRIFKRAFRRVPIKLSYSKGYNPHPRMSMAQPLSLGFESAGEYLEFETVTDHEASDIVRKLNNSLPLGIAALKCRRIDRKKTAASLVSWASYEMIYKNGRSDPDPVSFMKTERVFITKKSKRGEAVKIDIRPFVLELKRIKGEEALKFSSVIRAGSDAYLNPVVLMEALFDLGNVFFDSVNVSVKRMDLFDANMISLMDL